MLAGLTNRITNWRNAMALQTGWLARVNRAQGHRAIVMFHSVLPRHKRDLHLRNTTISELEEVVHYLRRVGEIVPLQQWIEENKSGQFAITFDDGLVNNLLYAAPLLSSLDAPATYFINTPYLENEPHIWPELLAQYTATYDGPLMVQGIPFKKFAHNKWIAENGQQSLIDFMMRLHKPSLFEAMSAIAAQTGRPTLMDEQRVMNAQEIRQLSKMQGVGIGSHGMDHRAMTTLSDEELHHTLIQSKQYLEEHAGQKINSLAFPFGAVDRRVYAMALRCGYEHLIGVEAHTALPALKTRFGFYNHTTLATQLRALLSH